MYIEGLDVNKAIAASWGSESRYRDALADYCQGAENFLSVFCDIPEDRELPLFVSMIGKIKQASVFIGAAALSQEAACLESAGINGDREAVGKQLFGFYDNLRVLIIRIRAALQKSPGPEQAAFSPGKNKIQALRESLGSKNLHAIVQSFNKLF
jgi:HPt (histidine-containing phosphotransfer) domain-containing protein